MSFESSPRPAFDFVTEPRDLIIELREIIRDRRDSAAIETSADLEEVLVFTAVATRAGREEGQERVYPLKLYAYESIIKRVVIVYGYPDVERGRRYNLLWNESDLERLSKQPNAHTIASQDSLLRHLLRDAVYDKESAEVILERFMGAPTNHARMYDYFRSLPSG